MSFSKQIYIPFIVVKGSFIEELGSTDNRVIYPGKSFEITLDLNDFKDSEDYHKAWISITKAVKEKLNNEQSP